MNNHQLLQSGYYDEAFGLYKKLGGTLSEVPMRVGAYDIDTRDFIIELDEENHFNRYRLATLDSTIYLKNKNIAIKWVKKHKKYVYHYALYLFVYLI